MTNGPVTILAPQGRYDGKPVYGIWFDRDYLDEKGLWRNTAKRNLAHLYPGIGFNDTLEALYENIPADDTSPHMVLRPQGLTDTVEVKAWKALTAKTLNEQLAGLSGTSLFVIMEPHRTDNFIFVVACERKPNIYDEAAVRAVMGVRHVRCAATTEPAGYDYRETVLRVYAPGYEMPALAASIEGALNFG